MKYSIIGVFLAMILLATGYSDYLNGLPDADAREIESSQSEFRPERSAASLPAIPPGSITLNWALNEATIRHPSLAATLCEIKARKGAVQQAGLFPNPTLFGEIEEFGGSGDFSGTDAMAGRIGISQEFLLGGKIGKRVSEAEAATRIADLEHRANLIEIATLVETRFFEVFTLQEQLMLQSEQLSLIRKTHQVVSKRVEAGDTSPLDLVRSRVELASADIELKQTQKALETARYALAELWGATSPGFSTVSGEHEPHPNVTEQELDEALKKSPAWRLLEEHFALADAALDLAMVQRIPDIVLEGGIQRFNESDDHAVFVEARIPLPFFDRNQGGIAEAKAKKQKAQYEKEAGFLALQTEVQTAWRKMTSDREAVTSLETEVLPAAQNAYESLRKAYNAGEMDILALLDAQRTWVETRKACLAMLHEMENSRIALKRLLGEGNTVSPPLPADDNDNH